MKAAAGVALVVLIGVCAVNAFYELVQVNLPERQASDDPDGPLEIRVIQDDELANHDGSDVSGHFTAMVMLQVSVTVQCGDVY